MMLRPTGSPPRN